MSLAFCVLGSGSGGNSTLVMCDWPSPAADAQSPPPCFLVDCGLSPRAVNKRMAALGLGLTTDDIGAILVTHLDRDHFYPGWLKIIEKRGLPLYIHRHHRNAAWRLGLTARHVRLYEDDVKLDGVCAAVEAHTLLLAHDDLGSVGFVFEHAGLRLGYATDLGCVPRELFDLFAKVDALAIESNYDRQMQIRSGRPIFLKRRIMGGSGHLSNAQSLEAVFRIAETSPLSQIALLHLSRECNDPRLIRRLYECEAPHLIARMTITHQFEPSPLMRVYRLDHKPTAPPQGRFRAIRPADQLSLF